MALSPPPPRTFFFVVTELQRGLDLSLLSDDRYSAFFLNLFTGQITVKHVTESRPWDCGGGTDINYSCRGYVFLKVKAIKWEEKNTNLQWTSHTLVQNRRSVNVPVSKIKETIHPAAHSELPLNSNMSVIWIFWWKIKIKKLSRQQHGTYTKTNLHIHTYCTTYIESLKSTKQAYFGNGKTELHKLIWI